MTQTARRRNVAKLLARLNPKGMALQPSPGNSRAEPLETALDIAGALGAASAAGPGPHLAVLVLCLRWWPGVFEGPAKTVGYRTIHHQPKRHAKIDDKKRECFLRGCCERIPIEGPTETPAFARVVSLLARRLDLAVRARSNLPPELEDRIGLVLLDRWARAVIAEYRQPNHCQTCTPWGRAGEVPHPITENGKIVRVDWSTCPTCAGAAVLAWSVKRRARALKIGEHPFRNHLATHHDGALSLLRELEWRGARRLIRHLGFPDER